MRSLYLFFGQKRCGNHGMIEWAMGQINHVHGKCTVKFFNNKEPEKIGPKTKKSIIQSKSNTAKWVFFSYEDFALSKINFAKIIPKQKKLLGKFDKTYHILLLRDPFNLFASRLMHPSLRKGIRRNSGPTVELWKEYAREFLGETNYLPNKVCMSFNEWFSFKPYRKKLCKKLKLPFSDAGLNQVHDEGNGSSFDGMKYKRQAQKMKVLDRWRVFAEDEDYIKMIKSPGVAELSEKIFGELGQIHDHI